MIKEFKGSEERFNYSDRLNRHEQSLLGREIGVNDARFISVLNALQRESRITSWKRFSDNSPEDQAGKDYLIDIEGHEIPFSITSTPAKARERIAKHPDVPVIFLRRSRFLVDLRDVEAIKKEVLDKAKAYLNRKTS